MQPASEPMVAEATAELDFRADAWRRPLPLVLGALLAIVAVVRYDAAADGFLAAFCALVLVALAAIDLDERVLPNRIVLPAAGAALAAHVAIAPGDAPVFAATAVGAAMFLLLPLLFYPAGMGLGDVKLALLLGAWLGTAVVGALLIAFVAILPVSLFLLARHGSAARKMAIPFGPFLAFGAIVVGVILGGGS